MEIGIYDTLTMLGALEIAPPAKSFLWDTFVSPTIDYADNEIVQMDYVKGAERMAPFIEDNVGGVVMDRGDFSSVLIKFPTIAPERLITKQDALRRQAGETVYSKTRPDERAQMMVARDLIELRKAVALRKGWMVSQLLFETPGKMLLDVMTDRGLKKGAMRVTYEFDNDITVDTPWGQAGADPLGDIEMITDAARDTGGANPDIIILGRDAAMAYRADPIVQKIMDIRNMGLGKLESTYTGDYLKFLGLSPNGLEMYSYSATQWADDGRVKPLVPTDCVAALSRGLLKAVFGPILQVEFGDTKHSYYEGYQEVPLFFADYQKNTTGLRLTSRPMLAPLNADGWAVARVMS